MHFLKLVMSHGLDTTAPMLEAEDDGQSFEGVNKSAIVTGSPSGAVRGWSGASNSVLKHQASYRPSTRSSSSRFADNNKLLFSFTVIGLILIVSNFTQMSGVSAMPRCPPQGVDTNEEPVDCPYGVSTDYCGRKVCAKGPGQICGVGLFKLLGSCGEGLYCNCGRCTGCSLLTMECYDKTCV